jgi:2'-hydroxyisoflavone reductase
LKVLVLGGTAFVGRHMVGAALERGHDVTLFTRGRTNPALFPEAARLRGDRETDLAALDGREFDAVLDTSGYLPRVVRASAGLLAQRVGLYVFVSSISVYADAELLTESTPTLRPRDPASEDVAHDYGGLKALCELEAAAAFPGRALILRPGLVVGPHDYTGRFSYWPVRIAGGGEVLAPGDPSSRVSLIDARDLAAWTIRMVEEETTGTFNAAGPGETTLGGVLGECVAVTASGAELTWVEDDFLKANGVTAGELPLWYPAAEGGHPAVDVGRAVAAGLGFRRLSETIVSVLDGGAGFDPAAAAASSGPPRRPVGLARSRERELLEAWRRASRT